MHTGFPSPTKLPYSELNTIIAGLAQFIENMTEGLFVVASISKGVFPYPFHVDF